MKVIKLRDYQEAFIAAIYDAWAQFTSVLGVLPTGGGKCLAKGTPVLMFDGTVKVVEDIRKGDLLMGPDSAPRRVISTCSGREMMYRVTPVKGDPYTVNESHILSLKQTGLKSEPRYPCQTGKGTVKNVNVKDFYESSRNFRHTHKGWRTGVDWPAAEVDPLLPPYLLGLWLGDGSSRTAAITTADGEIVEYLKTHAGIHDLPLRTETLSSNNAAKTYHFSARGKWRAGVKGALYKHNLLCNKHVPLEYKATDRASRLSLLAGLIDSDGSLSRAGYDYISKEKKLAQDVAYLCRSLGFAAYVSDARKTCGNTGKEGLYYRVSISGDLSVVPVKVRRKKAPIRTQIKSPLVTGISVDPVGEGEYYGFEIDGDHLFLLGDFTVTHNTVCFASIVHNHKGAAAAVVHRKEILGQISVALALLGVHHRIIAPPQVITRIRRKHLKKFGKSFVDPQAPVGVVSVQTLTSKASDTNKELQQWVYQVTLSVFDEGHHYVEQGVWSKAVHMLSRGVKLFMTATPERADGKGLGRGHDGFAEIIVEGPSTKQLIEEGYLCRFKYCAPSTDLNLSDIPITASGELNTRVMRKRIVASDFVGDVVAQYQQFAAGKKALVFANDVETAHEVANDFKASGVTAAALSGETDPDVRDRTLDAFEEGAVTVLINVDLFDEGFDVPEVEAVLLARKTESLAKDLQMIGRALRPVYAKGFDLDTVEGRLAAMAAGPKPYAIVIDPVRNWERHGMPNWPRVWSLAGVEKGSRSKQDGMTPQTICTACTQPFERYYKACPYCGEPRPVTGGRSAPEQVDGDLFELDVDAMAALFERMDRADMSIDDYKRDQIRRGIPSIGRNKDLRRHIDTKAQREVLRNLVGWWVGLQSHRELSEVHRRFYLRFGIDIGTAFTLKLRETEALIDKITQRFNEDLIQ